MSVPIVFVTMPWDSVTVPSIRLGILESLVGAAGISVETRYFNRKEGLIPRPLGRS